MTNPNEQQDALVDLIARALFAHEYREDLAAKFTVCYHADRWHPIAQAALAAVREGHVLVPKAELSGMLNLAMVESDQRIEQMKRDSKIDPVQLLERYMEPHGRAGGDNA